jgi:hypothetical protein
MDKNIPEEEEQRNWVFRMFEKVDGWIGPSRAKY